LAAAGSTRSGCLYLHRKSLKAARAAENGVKILRLLIGTLAIHPTEGRAGRPHMRFTSA